MGAQPASDGSARIRQSWEIPFVATMTTGAILTAIGLLFKPDTNIECVLATRRVFLSSVSAALGGRVRAFCWRACGGGGVDPAFPTIFTLLTPCSTWAKKEALRRKAAVRYSLAVMALRHRFMIHPHRRAFKLVR
jgi:hypothetical protein